MVYELTVILRITDAVETLKDWVKKNLQKNGFTILSEDQWDVKKFAYIIDGENEGYYLFMNIEAPPESVKKVIADFRINRDILRYLFIKDEKKKSA